MNKFQWIIVFILGSIYQGAWAQSARPMTTHSDPGINLAGAEFAPTKLPGIMGKDYQFPTQMQLAYYRSKGMENIRLPISWERVQPQQNGTLNLSYLNEIKRVLRQSYTLGLSVVIDLHNYMRFDGIQLQSDHSADQQAFKNIWQRLASELKDYPALKAYGLMNEPNNCQGGWHQLAQYGVDGVRNVDSKTAIYVSGAQWSSSAQWSKVNTEPFVIDPHDNLYYEAHIYFDRNGSGKYLDKIGYAKQGQVTRDLMPFILWLDKHRLKGVIGEWGVPTSDAHWLSIVDEFLSVTKYYGLDWYVWAGGAWQKDYRLSLEPEPVFEYQQVHFKDKVLMQHLQKAIRH